MPFSPDLSAFRAQWDQRLNQTVSITVVVDTETPVTAYLKLGHGRPYSFLLESIEGGAVRGRYSIIGRDPDLIWRCDTGGQAWVNRKALTRPDAFEKIEQSPLLSLRDLLDECRIDNPDQPQPMAAGLFGYLGYDMVRSMERIPDGQPHVIDVPDAVMIRPSLLAIFDQIENKFTLVTPVWFDPMVKPDEAYAAAETRLKAALNDLKKAAPQQAAMPQKKAVEPSANMSEAAYGTMADKAKEYIRAGDIFQVVLSQRFSRPFAGNSFDLYRAVRRLDPSPFLYHFNFGKFAVVGSSPEILVRVRDTTVTIRPIAGTRPRGLNGRSDADLSAELLADPKELAEHLMLLDLGRNDVGRIAKIGSVKITARNTVEYYKHVMHIVSNVEGQLDPAHSQLDALIAGFPAGTVTGAPKVRAMEIIAELEPDRRGIYGGCMGYFGANGNMDTCIAIRTAIIKDGVMHVQAGAGIVYDSDPQAEYRECVVKARGMMKAAEEIS